MTRERDGRAAPIGLSLVLAATLAFPLSFLLPESRDGQAAPVYQYGYAIACVAWLLAIWLAGRVSRLPLRWIVALALLGRALLLPAAVSDDVYRYVGEGRARLHGFNPYVTPPGSPDLVEIRTAWWPQINHPNHAAIYPPTAQGIFTIWAALFPDAVAYKYALILCELLAIGLLALWLRRSGQDPGWVFVYALCPAALNAVAREGHLDALLVLGLCLLGWATAGGVARRSDLFWAGCGLGLAVGSKWVAVLLIPWVLFWLWRAEDTVRDSGTQESSTGDTVRDSGTQESSTGDTVRDSGTQKSSTGDTVGDSGTWESSTGGTVRDSGTQGLAGGTVRDGGTQGLTGDTVRNSGTRGLAGGAVRGGGAWWWRVGWLLAGVGLMFGLPACFYLDHGIAIWFGPLRYFAENFHSLDYLRQQLLPRLGANGVALLAAGMLLGVGALTLRLSLARCQVWMFGVLLILSPTLHPWYVVWLLPGLCQMRRSAWLILPLSMAFAFEGDRMRMVTGTWQQPDWVAAAVHLPLYAGLAVFAVYHAAGLGIRRDSATLSP